MPCDCSEVGAYPDLVSLPNSCYLLDNSPQDPESTLMHFTATKVTYREIGVFRAEPGITITAGGGSADLVFCKPGIHAAGHVFHAGESVIEEKLDGFGGTSAGLAMDEDFPVRRQVG